MWYFQDLKLSCLFHFVIWFCRKKTLPPLSSWICSHSLYQRWGTRPLRAFIKTSFLILTRYRRKVRSLMKPKRSSPRPKSRATCWEEIVGIVFGIIKQRELVKIISPLEWLQEGNHVLEREASQFWSLFITEKRFGLSSLCVYRY